MDLIPTLSPVDFASVLNPEPPVVLQPGLSLKSQFNGKASPKKMLLGSPSTTSSTSFLTLYMCLVN